MWNGRNCWLCGRNGSGDPLDKHHIFGGANRGKSEKYGLTVYLCHGSCHLFGERAAHNCRETMDELHRYGQRKAMEEQGWSREDFVREFGRNYLEASECAGAARMDRSEGERRAAEAARRPARVGGKPGVAERMRRDINDDEDMPQPSASAGTFQLLDAELDDNW